MQYHLMTKEELEISNISDITSIYLYDILNPKSEQAESLLGIVTIYKDTKALNYVQTDDLFEMYWKKIISQYHLEKENGKIKISDNLKILLESSQESLPKEIASFLSMQGFDHSKIRYHQIKINEFANILCYELENIQKLMKEDLKLNREIMGYRSFFQLSGKKNNQSIHYSVCVEKLEDYSLQVIIHDFFDVGNDLHLKIDYHESKIQIHWINKTGVLSGIHEYQLLPDQAVETAIIYHDGQVAFYDHQELPSIVFDRELLAVNQYLQLFGIAEEEKQIYLLPHGDYCIMMDKEIPLNKQEWKRSQTYLNLTVSDHQLFLKRQSESVLVDTVKKTQLLVEGIQSKCQVIFVEGSEENYGVIETKYLAVDNAVSSYKNHLANQYFYQYFTTSATCFQNLEEVQVQPFSNLGYYDKGYCLLNPYQVKKLIKRGNE